MTTIKISHEMSSAALAARSARMGDATAMALRQLIAELHNRSVDLSVSSVCTYHDTKNADARDAADNAADVAHHAVRLLTDALGEYVSSGDPPAETLAEYEREFVASGGVMAAAAKMAIAAVAHSKN